MKKILILLILFAGAVGITQAALVYDDSYYNKHIDAFRTFTRNDPYRRHLVEVGALLFPATGDATVWYVNSNVSSAGDGTSWTNAFATLDEGINACSVGDFVDVAEGHAESGTDPDLWDADIAGITIRHYGNGSRMGTYTFADIDTTVSIGAANVTIIGGRLLAGISEVVIGMEVTAAADYLTVVGMEFPEPTTSGFEFNIAVQLVTGADDVSFIRCKAYSADAVGADHWLNGGTSIVNRLTLINNIVHGQFAIAPIFSDQADLECYIAYNTVTNMTAGQQGIEFTANATGWMIDNLVSTSTIGDSYDPGQMSESGNMWDDFDTYDTTAVPWTTNETGVNRWGATELAQIEGEVEDALAVEILEKFIANIDGGGNVYPDSVVAQSILAFLMCTGANPAITSFDNTTDSLEAIADRDILILADTAALQPQAATTVSYTKTNLSAATGDTTIFTVANGPVKVLSLFGIVTNQIKTTTINMKYVGTATSPGATDVDITSATDTNNDAAGTIWYCNASFAGAMVPITGGVGVDPDMHFIMPAGVIKMNLNANGDADDEVIFYIRYQPMISGAVVTGGT